MLDCAGPPTRAARGYVVEYIDWYRCVVPEGVVPVNQDGEVAQFRLMDAPTRSLRACSVTNSRSKRP